jgi:hypothetical protein
MNQKPVEILMGPTNNHFHIEVSNNMSWNYANKRKELFYLLLYLLSEPIITFFLKSGKRSSNDNSSPLL